MYSKVKGTNDVLMEDAKRLSSIEAFLKRVVSVYGFEEIRVPILSQTELIHRSSGDTSDIVKKETFDFEDRGGRMITLRPEGTAPVIRAVIENKLYTRQLPLKLFYMGDMFRYERPQKGRYREFSQFGVEVVGTNSPYMDAEVILMASTIFKLLQVKKYVVKINTLGDKESRENYKKALKEYFKDKIDNLCPDCKERLNTNPLRILDCKVDAGSEILLNAPKINDYLSEKSKAEFEIVKKYLELMNVPFVVDTKLVRGLDYYTSTVFEVVIDTNEGGQSATICGGGRYDDLIKSLGGPELGCVGFGFGLERLADIVDDNIDIYKKSVLCQLIPIGDDAKVHFVKLLNDLRLQGIDTEMDYEAKNLKQHFKAADSNNAKFIIIAGDEELKAGTLNVKNKITNEEVTLHEGQLIRYMMQVVGEKEESCGCGCHRDDEDYECCGGHHHDEDSEGGDCCCHHHE